MTKNWFLVSGGEGFEQLYELFYADSIVTVQQRTSGFPEGARMTSLSWRGLSELTGCEIPQQRSPDSLANGPMTYDINNRKVIVHGDDEA